MIDDTWSPDRSAAHYCDVVFITVPPKSISSKPSRTYKSQLRQQQAEATRSRILGAAADLFAADGYTRTTLAKIAATAGVSAETVQGQGPKAALLIAAIDYAAFGVVGERDVFKLDVGRRLLAVETVDQALDSMVAAVTEVLERTAPLARALLGGVSADPELERYLDSLLANVKLQNGRVLEAFRERGLIRNDVPFGEVVETSVVICSVDTYLQLTQRGGWSVDAYRAWCRRMLAETVFVSSQSTSKPSLK